jgi:hypothetical protein
MNKEELKMKVLINKENVVVAKAEKIDKVENGFFIQEQDTIYSPENLTLVETNLDPIVQKDLLVNGKIVKNVNYKDPKELKIYDLVIQEIITKEQYKTLTGKDFVV